MKIYSTEPANDNADLNPQAQAELVSTAYHEAGHAVMAMLLGRTVHKVTVSPGQLATGGRRLGLCEMTKRRHKPTHDWLEDEVLIMLAGMVAQSQVTGHLCEQSAAQDLRAVRRLLLDRAGNERQFERLQQRMLDKTHYLLSDPATAKAVELVAKELLAKQTVSGRAVRHFIELAAKR